MWANQKVFLYTQVYVSRCWSQGFYLRAISTLLNTKWSFVPSGTNYTYISLVADVHLGVIVSFPCPLLWLPLF